MSISSAFAGVSCDACMKSNFSSLRFKCLVCYDYDLCASCRDSGATSSRHTASHPMQCIMTRADLSKNFAYVFFLSTKTFHHFWLPLCVCVCVFYSVCLSMLPPHSYSSVIWSYIYSIWRPLRCVCKLSMQFLLSFWDNKHSRLFRVLVIECWF